MLDLQTTRTGLWIPALDEKAEPPKTERLPYRGDIPNKMKDLTVIFLTANEVPESWAAFQTDTLLKAIGDYPLISVSRRPMTLGNNILDTEPKSLSNIYRQMLRAAKEAETPFVAIAEDDCLYHKEHFSFYRPEMRTFAYNQNRLALFTWGRPTYSWRNRKSNSTLIAPRQLLIEALEERFEKYPDGTPEALTGELGRERIEGRLGLSHFSSIEVFSSISVIQLNHEAASEERQRNHRKRMGPVKAYDIPHWGRARDLIKRYESQ